MLTARPSLQPLPHGRSCGHGCRRRAITVCLQSWRFASQKFGCFPWFSPRPAPSSAVVWRRKVKTTPVWMLGQWGTDRIQKPVLPHAKMNLIACSGTTGRNTNYATWNLQTKDGALPKISFQARSLVPKNAISHHDVYQIMFMDDYSKKRC